MSYWLGIDVASKRLDVHLDGADKHFCNSEAGLKKLVGWLKGKQVDGVVMEATGGYERRAWELLHKSGYDVAVVNPWRVRKYAQAIGFLHKNDRIDASVASQYGEAVKPRFCVPKSEVSKRLEGLVTRRIQLIGMRTQELNRQRPTEGTVSASLVSVIQCLTEQIEAIDMELETEILSCQVTRQRFEVLQSYCGIGKRIAIALIILLPELGELSNKHIAALAGVAPWVDQSGKKSNEKHIFGGRAPVRSQLFMAALVARRYNPVIKQFSHRLIEKGKKPRVVTIACARRILVHLNAMLRDGQCWDPKKPLKAA